MISIARAVSTNTIATARWKLDICPNGRPQRCCELLNFGVPDGDFTSFDEQIHCRQPCHARPREKVPQVAGRNYLPGANREIRDMTDTGGGDPSRIMQVASPPQ